MIYLILGAGAVAVLVWMGRRSSLDQGQFRLIRAGFALAAFAAAAFLAVRGQLLGGAVLLGLGVFIAPFRKREIRAPGADMSAEEARSILGVKPEATAAEIQEAYRRLMMRAHPDQGGTSGLAAKLNAARERLMR